MSHSFWPKQLAVKFHEKFGYEASILAVPDAKLEKHIRDGARSVSIEHLVRAIPTTNHPKNASK
jgi:hypothetical protein